MDLVTSPTAPPWLARPTAPLRLRPGDRPEWVDLSNFEPLFGSWRSLSDSVSLPLEVVLSLLLEWALVTEQLADHGISAPTLVRAELVEMKPRRLAPSPDLRAWVTQLEEGCPDDRRGGDDDLPDAALPQRLVAQMDHGLSLLERLPVEHLRTARLCDAASACAGLTLERWLLTSALRALDEAESQG